MAVNVVSGTEVFTENFSETLTTGFVIPQTPGAGITVPTIKYTNGTGAGQVDMIYNRTLTLAASTPQTLDLTAIPDMGGTNQNMARVRLLVVQVVDPSLTHVVTVEQGAANGWAFLPPSPNGLTAFPGGRGVVHLSDPDSVGALVGMVVGASSKTIKLDPGAITVVVNVLIVGCSATS